MKAVWNDTVIAESENTIVVENNHYFPPDSIIVEFFKPSSHTTVCSWKGTASYYSIEVNGQVNKDAAWFYPKPKSAAENIRSHIAFWKGVTVSS